MTIVSPSRGPVDLTLLDTLRTSNEAWVDRADDARQIIDCVTRSKAPIIVLVGGSGTGKTELLRQWVVPRLSEYRVTYTKTCPAPEDVEPDAGVLEFHDGFERCLTGSDETKSAAVGLLRRVVMSPRGARRVVIVVQDEALSLLVPLSTEVPHLLDEVHEIPPLSGDRIVEALVRHSGTSLGDAVGLKAALAAELDALPSGMSPRADLAACLVFELMRSETTFAGMSASDFKDRGGLAWLLERHLDFLFEHLPEGVDPQMAWAVVAEAALRDGLGVEQVEELALRFEASPEAIQQVVSWLEQSRGVLTRCDGRYRLTPRQLALAAAARLARDGAAKSQALLRTGVKQFCDTESLLSEHHFKRVHADRRSLRVSDEEAKLMLRCAIAYECHATAGATAYWLRRIRNQDDAVDILFEPLFDRRPELRARAASHLAGSNRPEVRNQLLLVALRDEDAAVRTRAIDSLRAMSDEALLASLIRETRDRHSPHRLRALEALGSFDVPEATECLVHLIGANAAGEDAEARRLAIDVLARQNNSRSAEALVHVAINDPDADDRGWAAGALATVTDESAVKSVFAQLPERSVWQPVTDRATWIRGIVETLGAAALVLPGLLITGLVLATMKRWALAAVLTAGGLIGLWLGSRSGWAILLFWVCVAVGMLWPLRVLMNERLHGHAQGPHRRALGRVLFGISAFTWFALLPGLPAMLAHQTRRGLGLFGMQIVGGSLVFVSVKAQGWFDVYAQASTGLRRSVWVFAIVGIVLWFAAWVLGIVSGLRAFMFRQRTQRRERTDAVYAALVGSRTAGRLLVEPLTTGQAVERWRWRVFRRWGTALDDAMKDAWKAAAPDARPRVFRALCRRRDAAAMEFLNSAVNSLGWAHRIRFMWTACAYRLSLWPAPVLYGALTVLAVQAALTFGVWKLYQHSPPTLEYRIGRSDLSKADRIRAAQKLQMLAAQDTNRSAAASAYASLKHLVEKDTFRSLPPDVQYEVLNAIGGLAHREMQESAAVRFAGVIDQDFAFLAPHVQDGVLSAGVAFAGKTSDEHQLHDSVWQLRTRYPYKTIETLQQLGGKESADRLSAFITDPLLVIGDPKEKAEERQQRTLHAKRAALAALAKLARKDAAAIEALRRLERDTALPQDVRAEAGLAADAALPVAIAEAQLNDGQVASAIETLRPRLSALDPAQRAQAQRIVAAAYLARAQQAYDAENYLAARDNLVTAIENGPQQSDVPVLVSLGFELAFWFHERRTIEDPKGGYGSVYSILNHLDRLPLDELNRRSLRANLAESSFTTGRAGEAVALASAVIGDKATDQSTGLNVRFLKFAALTCAGRAAEAQRAKDDLAKFQKQLADGFQNSWVYDGTRRYIESPGSPCASIPPERNRDLLSTLASVAR